LRKQKKNASIIEPAYYRGVIAQNKLKTDKTCYIIDIAYYTELLCVIQNKNYLEIQKGKNIPN
jgi:hypothetical protein